MKTLSLLLFALLTSGPPAFAAVERYVFDRVLSDRDPNRNLVNDRYVDVPRLHATPPWPELDSKLHERLHLSESFVRSFTLIAARTAARPNAATLIASNLFEPHGEILRESIIAAYQMEAGNGGPLSRVKFSAEVSLDPQKMIHAFRRLSWRAVGAAASVQLNIGDCGALGKSATIYEYANLTGRALVLMPHDPLEPYELAQVIQRAIHDHGNPILLINEWGRQSNSAQDSWLMLFKHRELLGDASVMISENSHERLPAMMAPDEFATDLIANIDAIHNFNLPDRAEDYAEMITRLGFAGLNEHSRWPLRIGLEALELQQHEGRSSLRDIRKFISLKGEGCESMFNYAEPEANEAAYRMVSVIREYYEQASRRY